MKGWLKPRRFPSVDSEVMVSAHLTESVLMEPVTSMRAAKLRWNQFMVALCSRRETDAALGLVWVTRIFPRSFRSPFVQR